VSRRLFAAIALLVTLAAGCRSSSFAAHDLSPAGARHVAVALQPTMAESKDGSEPEFCGRACAPALRPGERVHLCRRLRIEPVLANDLNPRGSKVALCTLR
jgi:hypothetical protein